MNFKKDQLFLKVKDHSVSGETFELFRDADLDILQTMPQPSQNDLPKYYESDDYISHTDSKRSVFEKMYQTVKNIALHNKLKLINSLSGHKGQLLDIGAGTGDFLNTAKQNGWHTVGTEPSAKAKSIALKKTVNFVESTSELADHSLDVITMWHVLEHVPNPELQIAELKRLIHSTGTIIIAVPNFNSYDAKHYGTFWAAYDVPRHLWHFSRTGIEKLFSAQGMHVEKVLPMPFDAFYVSLLSEKYKTGKMNFISAFLTGLRSNWKGRRSGEYSSHIYVIKNAKNE